MRFVALLAGSAGNRRSQVVKDHCPSRPSSSHIIVGRASSFFKAKQKAGEGERLGTRKKRIWKHRQPGCGVALIRLSGGTVRNGVVARWRRPRRAERGTRPSIVTGTNGRFSGMEWPFYRSDALESGAVRVWLASWRPSLTGRRSVAGAKAAALALRGNRLSQTIRYWNGAERR